MQNNEEILFDDQNPSDQENENSDDENYRKTTKEPGDLKKENKSTESNSKSTKVTTAVQVSQDVKIFCKTSHINTSVTKNAFEIIQSNNTDPEIQVEKQELEANPCSMIENHQTIQKLVSQNQVDEFEAIRESKPAEEQVKELLYSQQQLSENEFEFKLLRQLNKLQRQIPSTRLKVHMKKVKIIAYKDCCQQGFMRSVTPHRTRPDTLHTFSNYLFHRSDFRNMYFLIPLIRDAQLEFTIAVVENELTIPRLLYIDTTFLRGVKRIFQRFTSKYEMLDNLRQD